MSSLKSFIKSVRNSKTIASERAAIRKESAKIRTAFRDIHLDESTRRSNISKLIYLYILGEPTYFGQVECLKLLVSNKFTSKRLGYMATMLILDENQEILTLLTNSLDNDMKNPDQFIAGLALCTLGNIASPELAQDLYNNVENLLGSSNIYLKKKAAIVAAKLVEKNPDLSEIFLPRIQPLLKEVSHGVLLGALHLIRSIYINDESSHASLNKQIPTILAHLRFLNSTGYSPEYDVKGIPDPFLYVSLLQTLRLLMAGEEESSENLEALNDWLTQTCSKLDNTKNAGYAVLYEAVQTIFVVNSDSSLKVLGVNILSKLLTQKDNNARYVALNTLLNVIEYEPLAVQRHRATVIGCLQDLDISIRRRALELSFAIMNHQNIRVLTKELLEFLKKSDDELKTYVTTQLSIACNKFSPNFKWHFETLIAMLKIAGNYFSNDVLSSILALIMQNKDLELTKFFTVELIKNSKVFYNQYGLALVTIWCVGEYGDLVLGYKFENALNKTETVSEDSLVTLLETFLNISTFDKSLQSTQIKTYALTTALKLSSKFKDSKSIESLRKIINSYTSDYNLEIQIRAIEYNEIFGQPLAVKRGLLERMPPPPVKHREDVSLLTRGSNGNPSSSNGGSHANKSSSKSGSSSTTGNLLLDLLGDDVHSNNGSQDKSSSGSSNNMHTNTLDLLSEIFGSGPGVTKTSNGAVLGDSDGTENDSSSYKEFSPEIKLSSNTYVAPVVPLETIQAFRDDNLSFSFIVKEMLGNGTALLEAKVLNVSQSHLVKNINVLCAVTKQQKLQLSSISKSTLSPSEDASLQIKITGQPGSKIKIRVKVGYEIGTSGEIVNKQFDFAGISKLL